MPILFTIENDFRKTNAKDSLCQDITFPSNKFARKKLSIHLHIHHTHRSIFKANVKQHPSERVKRSEENVFIWKRHCLFCGEDYNILNTDTKHPYRQRTSDQHQKEAKESSSVLKMLSYKYALLQLFSLISLKSHNRCMPSTLAPLLFLREFSFIQTLIYIFIMAFQLIMFETFLAFLIFM